MPALDAGIFFPKTKMAGSSPAMMRRWKVAYFTSGKFSLM